MKLTRRLTAAIALAASAVLLPAAASAAPARSAPARSAAAAAPACSTSLETWFAPEGNGYTGGAVYVVEFSNIGKATCTVTGYPTVKLTENGTQVGLKATTSGAAPATVTLKPGQTAHVALTIRDAGALCRPLPTNGLSVQPPGKTAAPDFPLNSGACRHKSTTDVDAISPGVGIPFYTHS
jgi:hypothetical protein